MTSNLFTVVEGVFYRAIDPIYRSSILSGSRRPGRYSTANQPTLYLSSSPEGVRAAMKAHAFERADQLQIAQLCVLAHHVFDLRDEHLRAVAGVSLDEAAAPWQNLVAEGKRPLSWDVRDRLVSLGAQGLIEPSRKAPHLWHLVLFEWNKNGAPEVQLIE